MQTSVTVDADSQWFSGHFPDDPILPGIAQLELIVKLISEATGTPLKLTGMSRVKFRKIVRPGDLLDIQVAPGRKKTNIHSGLSATRKMSAPAAFFSLDNINNI